MRISVHRSKKEPQPHPHPAETSNEPLLLYSKLSETRCFSESFPFYILSKSFPGKNKTRVEKRMK